jgi:hypothetical protein
MGARGDAPTSATTMIIGDRRMPDAGRSTLGVLRVGPAGREVFGRTAKA